LDQQLDEELVDYAKVAAAQADNAEEGGEELRVNVPVATGDRHAEQTPQSLPSGNGIEHRTSRGLQGFRQSDRPHQHPGSWLMTDLPHAEYTKAAVCVNLAVDSIEGEIQKELNNAEGEAADVWRRLLQKVKSRRIDVAAFDKSATGNALDPKLLRPIPRRSH
jgi:hypothetical protein